MQELLNYSLYTEENESTNWLTISCLEVIILTIHDVIINSIYNDRS